MRSRCGSHLLPAILYLVVFGSTWRALRAAEDPAESPPRAVALHDEIDRLIEAPLNGKVAPAATDAEFVRRVWLDVIGMIPPSDQARAFIDDPSPYKRTRLIDALMQLPEFDRRLASVLDLWLMERRADQHVPRADWMAYLKSSVAANKPYDQLVREILTADGLDSTRRAPAKFYLDRGGDTHQITRDVGRIFLGRDMACAQCHDHVHYDDYKQAHYQGLLAFLNRSYLVPDHPGGATFAEKADGDVVYKSVFKKKDEHKTAPRLLDGPELTDAAGIKGSEYQVAPRDKVHSIPTISRRGLLGPALTSGSVPEFDRAIANRLWALVMGRGIVHPVDLDHSENPPSHPELLKLLAREMRDRRYDLKSILREMMLTRTYARTSEPPPDWSDSDTRPESFSVGALRPLLPEQIAWSTMQATGVVESHRRSAERNLFANDPKLRDLLSLDRSRERMKIEMLEQRLFDDLSPSAQPFIQQFGRPPGQAQDRADATVQQALFLANGGQVVNWLAPSGDLLIGKLKELTETESADQLWLAILSRRPTVDERAELRAHLEKRGKDARVQALQEFAWSLLTSTEFRFNH